MTESVPICYTSLGQWCSWKERCVRLPHFVSHCYIMSSSTVIGWLHTIIFSYNKLYECYKYTSYKSALLSKTVSLFINVLVYKKLLISKRSRNPGDKKLWNKLLVAIANGITAYSIVALWEKSLNWHTITGI